MSFKDRLDSERLRESKTMVNEDKMNESVMKYNSLLEILDGLHDLSGTQLKRIAKIVSNINKGDEED